MAVAFALSPLTKLSLRWSHRQKRRLVSAKRLPHTLVAAFHLWRSLSTPPPTNLSKSFEVHEEWASAMSNYSLRRSDPTKCLLRRHFLLLQATRRRRKRVGMAFTFVLSMSDGFLRRPPLSHIWRSGLTKASKCGFMTESYRTSLRFSIASALWFT